MAKQLDSVECNKVLALYVETKQAELEPCPFCGDTDDLEIAHTWTVSWWIRCEACDCQLGDIDAPGGDGTEAEHQASINRVVHSWNTRA